MDFAQDAFLVENPSDGLVIYRYSFPRIETRLESESPMRVLTIALSTAGAACLLLLLFANQLSAQAPQALDSSELHHLYRLSGRLYSGSQPEGEAGFAALQKLGVKTIISVDGARTDVELAKKYGMQYVHRPIGYEGIGREDSVEIVKAAKTLPGPVYVHCHHGKHRGPAAAAVCAMALEGWSAEQAAGWMRDAGTSPSYSGLYRTIEQFQPPSEREFAAAPNEFSSQVEPASFVEAMGTISLTYDRLKELAANDYRPLASAPDLRAAHEALQLQEHYRELMRTDEFDQYDDELHELMQQAEQRSAALHKILQRVEKEQPAGDSGLRKLANRALAVVGENCKTCHTMFRDGRKVQ
jgi:protein tyrosine phosphatase (PTP) superfamily phosphohydrolase (DUF442 family)